ncbi:MAG: MFS transporter [Gammaproteobacteria bacterium]|nr:MFS transporter [Gammaproteobacteria bacterium]
MSRQPRLTRIGRFEAAWYAHAFATELVLIYPVFGIMMLEGVSKIEFSVLLVIWSGVAIVLEVPLGTLADRLDRRTLLTIGGVIEGLCFLCWTLMPGFWGYALGFITWAIAGALQSGTSESLIYDTIRGAAGHNPDNARKLKWIESIYTRIYGRALAARSLGATFALILGGYVATWLGYQQVLLLSVLAPWLGAAVLWWLIRDPRTASEGGTTRSAFAVIQDAIREIMPNPELRHFLLAFATLGATFGALEEYIGPMYQEKPGVTLGLIGVIAGVAYLGASIGMVLAERLRLERHASIHLLMALSGVMLLGCVFVPGALGVVCLVAYFFTCSISFVHLQSRMQMRIRGDSRATVTSAAWMLDAIIGIVFYLLMGAVAEVFDWHAAFIVIALVTILCASGFAARVPKSEARS